MTLDYVDNNWNWGGLILTVNEINFDTKIGTYLVWGFLSNEVPCKVCKWGLEVSPSDTSS